MHQLTLMTTERLTNPLEQDFDLRNIVNDFESGAPLAGLLERLEAKQIRGSFDTMDNDSWRNGFTGYDYANQCWITF